MQDYIEFLQSKIKRVYEVEFDVDPETLNKNLFDFQRYIVAKAVKMGKYAVFADCGLGKTLIQLEWARLVSEHTQSPVLILCPLAVAGQELL
jgi:superfamily II DNA or RNA helicase